MHTIPVGLTLLRKVFPVCAFVALLFCARPASAALGGDASSIGTGQTHLLASARIERTATHTMHELQAATGTKVREYLGNDGKVFAVSWQGPFRPDLRQLFGSYYETYLKAAGSRVARGPVNIRLPGLVIHMSGHQRALYGRVYLADRVPQGLSTDEIR
ncbi:MAG TPA: DUF2844 domain-containing protein [Polyangia bacterium]|jgi:hypothetical protein|nr:DUF2844 domain-containing protein [Polyangia bacterium]